jgi:hypothetical protein
LNLFRTAIETGTAAASAMDMKLQIAGGEIATMVTTTDIDCLAIFGLGARRSHKEERERGRDSLQDRSERRAGRIAQNVAVLWPDANAKMRHGPKVFGIENCYIFRTT